MGNKAEQRARKEQKQQAAKQRDKLVRLGGLTAIVVLAILSVYVLSRGLFGGVPATPPDRVAAHDQVLGNPEAALTITVYADFQCPSCATEMHAIMRAWPQIEDRVQLVFRHFPLDIHRHAFTAARYAEAAGRQGKFWEMHEQLFANQARWAGEPGDVTPHFDNYARELGLDMEQLARDRRSSDVRDKIVADQQSGVRAGVRGTPTMYFNGRRMSTPRSTSAFIAMVDEALSAQP